MYDVIYAAEIAICNINKLPLQLDAQLFQKKNKRSATASLVPRGKICSPLDTDDMQVT
jgi:hypothetical protein